MAPAIPAVRHPLRDDGILRRHTKIFSVPAIYWKKYEFLMIFDPFLTIFHHPNIHLYVKPIQPRLALIKTQHFLLSLLPPIKGSKKACAPGQPNAQALRKKGEKMWIFTFEFRTFPSCPPLARLPACPPAYLPCCPPAHLWSLSHRDLHRNFSLNFFI